jgi:two-component system OmpR family sensor kinase
VSLRSRMTAAVTVVTGVTLGGAFAIVSYVFNSLQLEQLDAELIGVARREAAEAPAHGFRFSSRPGPSSADVRPLTTYGVIYDEASVPLALTEPFDRDPPALGSLRHRPNEPFDFTYHDKPLRGVVVPVPGASGRAVLLATLRDDLDANEAYLDKAMLLTFVVAVAWAALVASWVVKRLTSDHEAIMGVARRVAGGDLGARVPDSPSSRDDELGQLGRDVNTMIETMAGLVRSQERFIAHAAHELRSPLAALQGELQQARRRERDAESYKLSIAASYQATRRLRQLADDLLTLARIAGERRESDELASAVALAGEVVRSLAPLAAESEVAVELDDRSDGALVRGRLEDLERLLRNVIENAVRYSPRGGRVRLAVVAEGAKVTVEVSDEGPGVAEADRDKIFEPFYRAVGTRGAAPGGTGLGLGIAREIARAHGGEVRVADSERGARFVIELPRVGVRSRGPQRPG